MYRARSRTSAGKSPSGSCTSIGRTIRRSSAVRTQAQAVAALEHPHVATVYDYWREPGRAFVVTRFLRGGSLRAVGSLRPLTSERATRMLQQVASALSALRRDVAHGNLRLLERALRRGGNAYLTDFSIGGGAAAARTISTRSSLWRARRSVSACR